MIHESETFFTNKSKRKVGHFQKNILKILNVMFSTLTILIQMLIRMIIKQAILDKVNNSISLLKGQ